MSFMFEDSVENLDGNINCDFSTRAGFLNNEIRI